MKYKAIEIIKNYLNKCEKKKIFVEGKEYELYLIPELCDEDLNLFEGVLFIETHNRTEVSNIISKYKPLQTGYMPRIALVQYGEILYIREYRQNKHIKKNLRKINTSFLKKLKKALEEPSKESFLALFDRKDIIDEFYALYKNTKEFLLKNIKGIPEEEKREEFVDNFMLQMLTLWYLQERGFFNNDKSYFITKFNEIKRRDLFSKHKFRTFYEFLCYFFEKISGSDEQYYEDEVLSRVVVIGPAVFLNGEHNPGISLPDKCFYKEGLTETLITTHPRKIAFDIPLLNLFESRDWTEGNIDEYVLGAIYEKLITAIERKKTGAYYTPDEITSYICNNTINPFIVERINEHFKTNFNHVNEIIETGEKKYLFQLFDELKNIKILDPAVGSAHFLESAINTLLKIYMGIWEKCKELGIKKGLTITATDHLGNLKQIDLLSFSDTETHKENVRLLIKFHIILSRNIYGVDINPTALKIARARLFLTLAKHFKAGKEKDIFIRFPNVHFNLREGNSLIGYVKIEKDKTQGRHSLFDFAKEKQSVYVKKEIQEKLNEVDKEYLRKISTEIGIKGDIIKDVESLDDILQKSKINWEEFEAVLRTKEKLIKILIVTLNSKYARPLHQLLNKITELFNRKLDEKFAEEHEIDFEELKKIKTFHWIFEFPEVFLDRGGFDVVIGNPPYGKIKNLKIPKEEKKLISTIYKIFYKKIGANVDLYKMFLERSLQFVDKQGYFSFLMPIMFWGDKESFALRKEFYNKRICKILHFPLETTMILFNNSINYEVSIFILRKEDKANQDYSFDIIPHIQIDQTKKLDRLKGVNLTKSYIFENSLLARLPLFTNYEIEKEILEFLKRFKKFGNYLNGEPLGWIFVGKLDETNDKKYLSAKPTGELAVASNHIKDWFVDLEPKEEDKRWIVNGDEFRKRKVNVNIYAARNVGELMKISPKIIGREVVNRGEKRKMHFTIYYRDEILTNAVRIIILKDLNYYFNKTLLSIINSNLINWFIRKYSLTYHIKPYEIEDFPIVSLNDQYVKVLSGTADFILFSVASERLGILQTNRSNFYLSILNKMIYELYFKEKFAEDGLYPESKEYLLEAVSKHLKLINYDRWAELYWKKQLEGSLSSSEEKELQKLEKENLSTIEAVYQSLKNDREVQKWIETIKSHEWVKVIEGEEG